MLRARRPALLEPPRRIRCRRRVSCAPRRRRAARPARQQAWRTFWARKQSGPGVCGVCNVQGGCGEILSPAVVLLLKRGLSVRRLPWLILLSMPVMAQEPITRGRLLESDTRETGELSIRTTANRVYWFVYDTKTYVEQDNHLSSVPRLRKGDELEVVSDTGPDVALRYARTIHVVDSPAEKVLAQRQFSQGRYAIP